MVPYAVPRYNRLYLGTERVTVVPNAVPRYSRLYLGTKYVTAVSYAVARDGSCSLVALKGEKKR